MGGAIGLKGKVPIIATQGTPCGAPGFVTGCDFVNADPVLALSRHAGTKPHANQPEDKEKPP